MNESFTSPDARGPGKVAPGGFVDVLNDSFRSSEVLNDSFKTPRAPAIPGRQGIRTSSGVRSGRKPRQEVWRRRRSGVSRR